MHLSLVDLANITSNFNEIGLFSINQGKIAEPDVNQKESINMKNEKGHLIELKERNTLE